MKNIQESDSFLGDIISLEDVTGQLRIVTEIHVSKKGPFRVLLGEKMGKRVIIKTLKEEYADDRQFLLMLRKEFEIGFSLSHPGIVDILDYQVVEGLGECIIEEYIDGESLDILLKKQEIEPFKAIVLLESIAETLIYIHKKGIVHGDLTPSNIIISSFYGMPKVIDFGFSDRLDYVSFKVKGGTSGYIAPERREKDYKPMPESDIWSIGEIADKLADKIKGKERRILRNIAKECKKPLAERISSAEELMRFFDKRAIGKKHLKLLTIGFYAFIISLTVVGIGIFISQKTENKNIHASVVQTNEIEIQNVKLREHLSGEIKPVSIAQQDEEETLIAVPKASNSLKDKREIPLTSVKNENKALKKETDKDYFKKEAFKYADQLIEKNIRELENKGVYGENMSFADTWNSHYIYNQILNEIGEYVEGMPIEDETVKTDLKEETVSYARRLLTESEKKLKNSEQKNN